MATRHAHLVGSIPGENPEAAMRLAMTTLGPRLRSLPDGETGERRNWIISIIESLRGHPDLELAKEGDWSDYDKTPQFKVKRGHRLLGASLDFGQVSAVEASRPAFEEVRSDSGRADLDYLVGMPGDFDMAMFTLGPAGALRHRRAFTEATVGQITRIHRILGDQAVFQLEVPAELVLLTKLPAAVIRLLPACSVSGWRRSRLPHPKGPVSAWPAGRALEFVHAPFAAADDPRRRRSRSTPRWPLSNFRRRPDSSRASRTRNRAWPSSARCWARSRSCSVDQSTSPPRVVWAVERQLPHAERCSALQKLCAE